MASINVDLGYFRHIKTLRIVARLGPGADVLPIKLWAYVGEQNPGAGTLKMLEAELEHALGWWGEKGALASALTEIGFATRQDNIWAVHDWLEHSGHLAAFHKRAVKAARKRWGIKKETSNATSNAKEVSKQCPSRTSSTNNTSTTKTPSAPNGAVSDEIPGLIDLFHFKLTEVLGEKPPSFNGGSLGKLFKVALTTHTVEDIKGRIDNWFKSTDPFIATTNIFSPTLFASKFPLLKGGPIHASKSAGNSRPANAFVAGSGEASKYD